LNLSGSGIGFDLSALRAFCDKQKVALIIDDAGELVPGLIGELADFAESLQGLRAVFALTHDEFHIKGATDRALEECHVIELPPLNRRQTLEYLQNLSAQPGASLSFNAISDELVDDLFRETHGIPGKLLAELPKLNQYQSRQQRRWGLWLGVAVVTAATGFAAKFLLPDDLSTLPLSNRLVSTPQTGAAEVKAAAENVNGKAPIEAAPAQESAPDAAVVLPQVPASQEVQPPAAASVPLAPELVPAAAPLPVVAAPVLPSPVVEPPVKANEMASPATPMTVEKPLETVAAASPAAMAKPPINPVTPVPEPAVANNPSAQAVTPAPSVPAVNPMQPPVPEPKSAVAPAVEAAAKTQQPGKTAPAMDKKPTENKTAKAVEASASENDWIMAQPAKNYTLQVMTLSTKDAALRFMKKYADYGEALKYYTLGKNGQEKFVVIYGSFESAAEARQYKEVMPGEFKQAMEKSFKAVQKESRR